MLQKSAGSAPLPASPGRVWYAVGILVVMYCMSYLDRMILALLAAPIAKSLAISDTQVGVLFGVGFGVLYAIVGLPLAHLVDRSNRVRIITIGVLTWSLSTIASGFAHDFTQLLLCRSGVAIGEAVLSPAAISILADLFPRDKRTLPTAIYTSVSTFMTTGAFVVGGVALDVAGKLAPHWGFEPWQLTLIFVGVPGLFMAPLFCLTVREPPRVLSLLEPQDYSTVRQAWDYVVREARLYGPLFVGMAAYAIITYGAISWTPTLLIRAFGMTPAQAGYAFGMVGVVAGVLGAIAWPWLAQVWTGRGRKEALVLVLAGGICLAVTSALMIAIAPSATLVIVASFFYILGGSTASILAPLVIQTVAPGGVKGRLMAGNLLASNLLGLGIGPPLVAALAHRFFTGPHALGGALAAVCVVLGPIAVFSMLMGRKPYAVALDAAAAREAPAVLATAPTTDLVQEGYVAP